MGKIVNANDEPTFDVEVIGAETPVVVDFWASWCGPCKTVAPEIEAIAASRDDVKVVKVDVDANQAVAQRYSIMSIPTIGLFDGGKLVATSVGAKPRSAIESDLGIVPVR